MALGDNRFEIDNSDPEPDLSPMIDCVFILLIFFIVTATFVEEDGLQVNRPDPSQSSSQASDNETVVLLIGKNNQVTYQGRNIGVSGVAAVVSNQLGKNEKSPIVIQGHPGSSHGVNIEVKNAVLEGGAQPSQITLTDQ